MHIVRDCECFGKRPEEVVKTSCWSNNIFMLSQLINICREGRKKGGSRVAVQQEDSEEFQTDQNHHFKRGNTRANAEIQLYPSVCLRVLIKQEKTFLE